MTEQKKNDPQQDQSQDNTVELEDGALEDTSGGRLLRRPADLERPVPDQ
jgi:hypothetical protein